MKKVLRMLLTALLIPAFVLCPNAKAEPKRFTNHFFGTFDTIISLIGYAPDQKTFDSALQSVQERFTYLHRLFDKYNAYEGINNLYTVNQKAAQEPVKVAPELMEVLVFCRDMQKKYPGTTNIALGSVLNIWHDYREAGESDPNKAAVPELSQLAEAGAHTDMDKVILNEQNSTIFFEDEGLSLDLGAVAKGYAAESAAQLLLSSPMTSFTINAGGNVRAGNKPLDGRDAWGVGIQNPFSSAYSDAPPVETLLLRDMSVVTSGINERYYEVDGTRYHHLIDPNTLFPARHMASVTIVTENSEMADFLSTALFMMPYEEGRALVDSIPGVDALWVLLDGTIHLTDGLGAIAVSKGAASQ